MVIVTIFYGLLETLQEIPPGTVSLFNFITLYKTAHDA